MPKYSRLDSDSGEPKSSGDLEVPVQNDNEENLPSRDGKRSGSDIEIGASTASASGSDFESKWRTAVTCPKGHPLSPVHQYRGGWKCDAVSPDGNGKCLSSGTDLEGKMRWRCEMGCDFDFCGPCYEERMRDELMPRAPVESQTLNQTESTILRKLERERRRLQRQIQRQTQGQV